MNPILYFIYQFLKLITRICFAIYYPNTTIINGDRLRFKKPSILVSNHPNTLMDPLNAGKEIPMIVHFLANASLFNGRFLNWFFNTFYCIPIERPQDTNGKPINNQNAFARCDDFLGKGGCLYIAPEGGSDMERKLRPIKTGTARIALSAEEKQNFQLGLTIQAVGLTYDAPNYFHSKVILNAGEPIKISDYQEAYETDKIAAVRQLTEDLDKRMRSLIIDTRDEDEDQFVHDLEKLLRTSFPLQEEAHFYRTQRLITQIRNWHINAPDQYKDYKEAVSNYITRLKSHHTTDEAVAAPIPNKGIWFLAGISSFPAFLYGLINNAIPTLLSLFIVRKMNLYIGYNTTVKVLAGLIFFPVFYGIQTWVIAMFTSPLITLFYFLSLFPTGWFAWWWSQKYKKWQADNKAHSVRMSLLEERQPLLEKLQEWI